MAELVLEKLCKRFGGRWSRRAGAADPAAVDDLDLTVHDGELLVLVGPSGCGKTTTLRLIAGLEKPTSGTIRVGGRVVNDDQPRARNVAMVFQDSALYPHMTARQNMSFGLKMRKTPKAEIDRAVRDAAGLLGIAELLDRRPGELSGGERQRVALGCAIVRKPACLLLDEPLSNLDAATRLRLRGELRAIHQRLKITTIHVTHDQEEAMTLGDRIAVMAPPTMDSGGVQQIGPPLEVYRHPTNRFVAGFIGMPPMNFIQGRLESAGGTMMFIASDSQLRVPVTRCTKREPASGQRVWLGVRPQHFCMSSGPGNGCVRLEARIDSIEPLGDQVDVRFRAAGAGPLIARVAAESPIQVGQNAVFTIDPEELHLFEDGPFGRSLGA